MNLLTNEECETIEKLSHKESLNLEGAGHTYKYYGVDRESNIEDIKILESILIKWFPDLISFSNFIGQEPNRIRVQCWYSDERTFQGVHYMDLPSNAKNND